MTLPDAAGAASEIGGPSAALAEAVGRPRLAARDLLDGWVARVVQALEDPDTGPLRLHRRLRVPAVVMARIVSSIEGPDHPYVAYALPPLLAGLSRDELDDPEVVALARPVVEAWRDLLRSSGSAGAGVAEEVLPMEGWEHLIDPGDWRRSATDAGSAEPQDEASVVIDVPGWAPWDASTRRALASLPSGLSSDERLALLLGIWSGGAHGIRTPRAWDAAQAWIDAADGRRVRRVEDLASARAWTLATDGPLVRVAQADRAALDRFLSWAHARASTWPTFASVDVDILGRLRALDAADGIPMDHGSAGDVTAVERRWPAWVRAAVESRRLALERAQRAVRREEPASADDVIAQLDRLEGLDDVKTLFRTLAAQVALAKARRAQGHEEPLPELHLVLTGNPGTGKTTVARLYGQLLRALGLLSSGQFVERVRSDLVSPYRGGPSERARAAIESAEGGVLFIDEAYSLTQAHHGEGDDTGQEIITELVAKMESMRGRFAVVLAGYPGPMTNFLASNPGLESRVRAPVLLPDLSSTALLRVLDDMAAQSGYSIQPDAREALGARIAALPRGERFGNAREVRRLLDLVRGNLAQRYQAAQTEVDPSVITLADVPTAQPGRRDDAAYAAAMQRLDRLVGLTPVKKELRAIAAQVELAQLRRVDGAEPRRPVVGHLVFAGNPGTGKTTVAAEVGAVLAALGVLASGHVHTVTNADLIAQYLGQTAPKVRAQVQQALDGVLFIDEAYSLTPRAAGGHVSYQETALTTLVEEMERHRDRLVVILAGYPKEMQALLEANQGLRSRISRTIVFPDYDRAELREIAARMVTASGLAATDEALDAMADTASAEAGRFGFGNARTVRELLSDAERRHALRVTGSEAASDAVPGLIDVADVRAPEAPRKFKPGFV